MKGRAMQCVSRTTGTLLLASLLASLLALAGCASTRAPIGAGGQLDAGAHPGAPLALPPDPSPLDTYDPWERANRSVYRFNARFDEAVFLPVAKAWRTALPPPVRSGIGNFFANLAEIGNLANYALQGRVRYGSRSLARLLLNSTLGIGGVFDVAAAAGLPRAPTSFGTTLARWGVAPGPYLVVPLLGPSTLRDGFGFLADFGITRAVDLGGLYSADGATLLGASNAVDTRSRIDFRYYGSGSPFEYETLRFLYTRKRMIEAHAPARPQDAERQVEEAQAR